MKILKSTQIREVDAYTIKNEPILSIDLMERAAMSITTWILENIPKDKTILLFAGPGNNGGDALAIARQLNEEKYTVQVYLLNISDKLSADCNVNLKRLKEKNIGITYINNESDFPEITKNDVILDGLFGSGLTRKIDGLAKKLIQHINYSGASIIAIDIPSGLFGEDNSDNDSEAIIKAQTTLTFQLPKLSFLFPENENYVGEWHVLPIGLNMDFINSLNSHFHTTDKKFIQEIIKIRSKFAHKGHFGHVLLVAGSYGKMGAALLAAKACLKTGTGLLTVHIPKIGYQIMQTSLPEAMVSIDWSELIFSDVCDTEKYTHIGVGPGIGTKANTIKGLRSLFEKTNNPMVIDADALNIVSENRDLLEIIPKNSILTPHPGEFERLAGTSINSYERLQKQIDLAVNNQIIIVLKGAYTSIVLPDGTCYFNTTGNPGMATAGSGDVLTGIILSLLGQGYSPQDAAIFGVYLHGLAGDIGEKEHGQEALIASDITKNLGKAFKQIK